MVCSLVREVFAYEQLLAWVDIKEAPRDMGLIVLLCMQCVHDQWCLHITLMCVDSHQQRLQCHPTNGYASMALLDIDLCQRDKRR